MNESTEKIRAMGRKIIEAKRARMLAKESDAKDILSLLGALLYLLYFLNVLTSWV